MSYKDLKTDEERLAFVKNKLNRDDRWIARGILVLYSFQTPREKRGRKTIKDNGKGFTSHDAAVLTQAAKELLSGGADNTSYSLQKPFYLLDYMPESLVKAARFRMPKYARQLLEYSACRNYPL